MPLWRLYYHLVWATAERLPLIAQQVEPSLYGYILGKADALGSIVHAVGGIEDHMHLIASIPPRLSISDFVKGIKGSSAHHLNHGGASLEQVFAWQRGYGVFSLGSKQVDDAIAYVTHQREHHRQGQVNALLESYSEEDDGPAPWNHGKAVAGITIIKPLPRETTLD
jgi:putative transposase